MSAGDPMALLVLGGTSWLGGMVAREAVSRGHQVTCLARGDAGSPPDGVTWIPADRERTTAYDQVRTVDWDAVVDLTRQPDFARTAVAALASRTEHWVCVSSSSVYADHDVPGSTEDAPTLPPHEDTGLVGMDVYGSAKVACETACLTALGPGRVTVARAGLIGGYGDRSDRLGYWPARLARAGDAEPVLVPPTDSPAQVVDVADLSSWLVRCAEQRVAGVFNASGDVHSVGEVLSCCAVASGRSPRWVPVSDDWLTEQGVQPWAGPASMPLWLPQPDYAGFMARRNDAARASGLELRPLQDTIAAALRWEQECGLSRERSAGLTPALEAELVARVSR